MTKQQIAKTNKTYEDIAKTEIAIQFLRENKTIHTENKIAKYETRLVELRSQI